MKSNVQRFRQLFEAGHDTYEIARICECRESEVYNGLYMIARRVSYRALSRGNRPPCQ